MSKCEAAACVTDVRSIRTIAEGDTPAPPAIGGAAREGAGGELSRALKEVMKSSLAWFATRESICFLRNYETLPDRPGRDIDILCSSPETLAQTLRGFAAQDGLFVVERVSHNGRQLVVLDLDQSSPAARRWIFFDFQAFYRWKGQVLLDGREVATLSELRTDLGVRALRPGAELLMLSAHLLSRRVQRPKYRSRLRQLATAHRDSVRSFLADRGVSEATLRRWMEEVCDENTARLSETSFTALVRELCTTRGDLPARGRAHAIARALRLPGLARRLTRYAKTPLRRPHWVVAVVGPDGVGKTTLCTSLLSALGAYPIRVCSFHQLRGFSNDLPKEAGAQAPPIADERLMAVRRWVRRFVQRPEPERRGVVASTARITYDLLRASNGLARETSFAFRFRRHLRSAAKRADLCIADRWFPITRPALLAAHTPELRWLSRLTAISGFGIRAPDLVIRLRDDAERIRERKAQLSEEQIRTFEATEKRQLLRHGVRAIDEWFVPDTTALCQSVLAKILPDLGEELFRMIDEHDRRAASRRTHGAA